MHPYYRHLEESALMAGMNPEQASFRVVRGLGQVPLQAGTFIPEIELPEPEAPAPVDPSEEFGTGTGTRIPDASTPGAVPIRPDRWNFETEPLATYRLALGDTFVGLATTYLGSGSDWREIWNVQTDSFRASHKPDVIFVDEIIRMPKRATDNMLAFLELGEPQGQLPGELTPGQKTKAKASKLLKYGLIAGGVLGGGYLLWRAAK